MLLQDVMIKPEAGDHPNLPLFIHFVFLTNHPRGTYSKLLSS